jgi:hypothetical protein
MLDTLPLALIEGTSTPAIFTQARHRYSGALPDGEANVALPKVTVPLALKVPVTAAPADVTATTVVPPLCMFRLPLLSAVVTTPPEPVVRAFIELAIYISPKVLTKSSLMGS